MYYVTTLYKMRGGRIDRSNVRFMVCQNEPNLYLYRVTDVNTTCRNVKPDSNLHTINTLLDFQCRIY